MDAAKGQGAFSKPTAKALELMQRLCSRPERMPGSSRRWRLAEAPKVEAKPADISSANYSDAAWHAATVPGTVLTTLIDRGVYPDYDYGLNNMAIPESLARQDYWYRTAFDAPPRSTANNSRSRSRASTTPPRCGSTAVGSATSAAPSFAACSTSPAACAGQAQCDRRARVAAAASRNSARRIHRGGSRRERRLGGARRPHVRRLRRLGLDPRHPRPQHRHLAGRRAARPPAVCGC